MLAYLSTIYDYRDFLGSQKCFLDRAQLKRLSSKKFKSAYHKLWKLDVGLARSARLCLTVQFEPKRHAGQTETHKQLSRNQRAVLPKSTMNNRGSWLNVVFQCLLNT